MKSDEKQEYTLWNFEHAPSARLVLTEEQIREAGLYLSKHFYTHAEHAEYLSKVFNCNVTYRFESLLTVERAKDNT